MINAVTEALIFDSTCVFCMFTQSRSGMFSLVGDSTCPTICALYDNIFDTAHTTSNPVALGSLYLSKVMRHKLETDSK
jgi:hypothetical protein